MTDRLSELLYKTDKPARYAGGEYNTPDMTKPHDMRFCMCFPDLYEVGMSNLGLGILYHRLNAENNIVCERCFAPHISLGDTLKAEGLPLFSVETRKPLKEFDMVGISVQYEMLYSNILYMLDLAGIPFYAKDRGQEYPLMVAGGPCSANPEPYADFFDLIVIGEGEECLPALCALYIKHKKAGLDKVKFLKAAERIKGVYAPNIPHKADFKVVKAAVADFDKAFYPTCALVPSMEIIHDRGMLELFRGCANGCRFCQAGFYYRPIRKREPETVIRLAKELIDKTGFEEISLASLSTSDYPKLLDVLAGLKEYTDKKHVSVALPSLRLNTFEAGFSESSRLSSLTFAPEAGTQRLRDVINKNISEADIENGLGEAFKRGYKSVKLYFMVGLPTETDEDIKGIADTVLKIKSVFGKTGQGYLNISVSCNIFIPKPCTPFQWEAQITKEEAERKLKLLRSLLHIRGVTLSWHDAEISELEAVLARGDRRLSEVIEKAYRAGARFDAWTEHFKYSLWQQSIKDSGLSSEEYIRERDPIERLPWDYIDYGVSREYLLKEREKAYGCVSTPDCRAECRGCGACRLGECKL